MNERAYWPISDTMAGAEDLTPLSTIAVGQTDDLKLEAEDERGHRFRWWLARTTTQDGEPYDKRITIERLSGGRWIKLIDYRGAP